MCLKDFRFSCAMYFTYVVIVCCLYWADLLDQAWSLVLSSAAKSDCHAPGPPLRIGFRPDSRSTIDQHITQ